MNVLILNCDLDRSNETNGAKIIKGIIRKKFGNSANLKIFNAFKNDLPSVKKLSSYDAIIITGSRASVYERKAWISNLKSLVKKIDKLSIPTLGICFGFQIVAEAFGGKVGKGQEFVEGFESIRISTAGRRSPLFRGLKRNQKVYESHGDILKKPAKGLKILAQKAGIPEAYALRSFYCVQFHPEILYQTAVKMAERDAKNSKLILNGTNSNYHDPEIILCNFVNYCVKNSKTK